MEKNSPCPFYFGERRDKGENAQSQNRTGTGPFHEQRKKIPRQKEGDDTAYVPEDKDGKIQKIQKEGRL